MNTSSSSDAAVAGESTLAGRKTILLVEDDRDTLNTLASHLGARYDVLVANDGVDAVYVYERNLERIAAVVTDLNMPRLDGQLLTEWVHHIRPRLPVILLSGSLRSTAEQALRGTAVTFLGKPFEHSRREKLLQEVLERGLEAAA